MTIRTTNKNDKLPKGIYLNGNTTINNLDGLKTINDAVDTGTSAELTKLTELYMQEGETKTPLDGGVWNDALESFNTIDVMSKSLYTYATNSKFKEIDSSFWNTTYNDYTAYDMIDDEDAAALAETFSEAKNVALYKRSFVQTLSDNLTEEQAIKNHGKVSYTITLKDEVKQYLNDSTTIVSYSDNNFSPASLTGKTWYKYTPVDNENDTLYSGDDDLDGKYYKYYEITITEKNSSSQSENAYYINNTDSYLYQYKSGNYYKVVKCENKNGSILYIISNKAYAEESEATWTQCTLNASELKEDFVSFDYVPSIDTNTNTIKIPEVSTTYYKLDNVYYTQESDTLSIEMSKSDYSILFTVKYGTDEIASVNVPFEVTFNHYVMVPFDERATPPSTLFGNPFNHSTSEDKFEWEKVQETIKETVSTSKIIKITGEAETTTETETDTTTETTDTTN